jgi:hypothetical protein
MMDTQSVRFVDASGNFMATGHVNDEGGHYGGTIQVRELPSSTRELFEEFEETVNDQMLSLIDEIQARIGALRVKVVFSDGHESALHDLQIYPSTGDVSFKLATPRPFNGAPAAIPAKARLD